MTLTARREPSFDGAGRDNRHEALSSEAMLHGAAGLGPPNAGPKPTGILRLASTMQIVGSLLAVPLGLASGYSIYKANFSAETTCQQLRGNIIAMLDKSVDATTRRMLVRRDVEAFEANCGSVDPDAHAAFKRLLAAEQPVAVPLPKAEPKPVLAKVEPKVEPKAKAKAEARVEKAETKTAKAEAKPESKPEPKADITAQAKAEAIPEPKAEPKAEAKAESLQRETALTDTRWVAAVRQALVKHPVAEEKPLLQPSWTTAPAVAEPLPPPQSVVPPTTPAPLPVVDHPVPPGSIPESDTGFHTGSLPAQAREPEHEHERSRLGAMISEIPVVGRMIRRGE